MSWRDTANPFARTSKTARSPTKFYTPLYDKDGEKINETSYDKDGEKITETSEQEKEKSNENSSQEKRKSSENLSQEKTDSKSDETRRDENVTQRKHKDKTEDQSNTKTDKKLKTRISCQFLHENKILDDIDFSFELPNKLESKLENPQDIKTFFEDKIEKVQRVFEEDHTKYKNFNDSFDTWSIDTNMVIPIKDITDLIKEYKGEEKDLNTFIKNIDRLWAHINAYEQTDKDRFMLVLQLKLVDKAADATKNVDFNVWADVKKALKDNINPQKNIEKAELKLNNIKQKDKEEIEKYAKRVEDALDNFNKSFNLDEENEILKRENDRKARKSFENGLFDTSLKNKVITRGNKTFKESVDYVIEQELRQSEVTPSTSNTKFCNYCKLSNHDISECRKRLANNSTPNFNQTSNPTVPNNTYKTEIICYKCSKKGHYANECRSPINTNSNQPTLNNNFSNNIPYTPFNQNRSNNANQNDFANNTPRNPFNTNRTNNPNGNSYNSNDNNYNRNNSNGNNYNRNNSNSNNYNRNNSDGTNYNGNNPNGNNSRQNRDGNNENRNSRNVRFYDNDISIEEATTFTEYNDELKN